MIEDAGYKVSVIIPAYNAAKYIVETVNSALKQNYRNLEVIVVNDGSTDSTEKVLRDNFRDKENVIIVSTTNYGVSHARNLGIEHAKGEYITFLDADDKLLPGAIDFLCTALEENNVDIACGSISAEYYECLKFGTYQILEKYDVIRACLVADSWFSSACAKLFRKSVIDETRFDEQLKVTEDGQFVFDICVKMPRVYVSDTAVYYYRRNYDSVSKKGFSDKYFDMIKTADRRYNFIIENYNYLVEEAIIFSAMHRIIMLKNLCRTDFRKYRTVISEYQLFLKENRHAFEKLSVRKKIEMLIFSTKLYWCYRIYYRLRFARYLR